MRKLEDTSWGHKGGIGTDPQRRRQPKSINKKKKNIKEEKLPTCISKDPLGNINKGMRYGGL